MRGNLGGDDLRRSSGRTLLLRHRLLRHQHERQIKPHMRNVSPIQIARAFSGVCLKAGRPVTPYPCYGSEAPDLAGEDAKVVRPDLDRNPSIAALSRIQLQPPLHQDPRQRWKRQFLKFPADGVALVIRHAQPTSWGTPRHNLVDVEFRRRFSVSGVMDMLFHGNP